MVGGWPIFLYGVLSGYGRSYFRPHIALFVIAAIGAGAFWYFDARTCGEALSLSAANTLNVFGFRRDFGSWPPFKPSSAQFSFSSSASAFAIASA